MSTHIGRRSIIQAAWAAPVIAAAVATPRAAASDGSIATLPSRTFSQLHGSGNDSGTIYTFTPAFTAPSGFSVTAPANSGLSNLTFSMEIEPAETLSDINYEPSGLSIYSVNEVPIGASFVAENPGDTGLAPSVLISDLPLSPSSIAAGETTEYPLDPAITLNGSGIASVDVPQTFNVIVQVFTNGSNYGTISFAYTLAANTTAAANG